MKIRRRCRRLPGVIGLVILSGCTTLRKERHMETLYLEGIEYPKRESSYMACALGAAKYLGYDQSEAWLYGSCGMAFFSHVTRDGMCWSYPTDWNAHECMPHRASGRKSSNWLLPDRSHQAGSRLASLARRASTATFKKE